MRPLRHESSIAVVAQRVSNNEVEPRSILLFFALLSAFIAILTLRAHLLVPAGSGTSATSAATAPTALAAKFSSLRPAF
jgi:hypothetical protein